MNTRVHRWGNSLALRIPKALAEASGLELNSEVELRLEGTRIIVTPRQNPRYTLDSLLAAVTAENRHDEWDTGATMGREEW